MSLSSTEISALATIKELESKLAATQHVLEQMREALKEMVVLVKDYHKEVGGCDHSVGICMCGERAQLADAEEVLSLQVSTDALDDYRKSALEEAAHKFHEQISHSDADGEKEEVINSVLTSVAAELRRMASERKQGE